MPTNYSQSAKRHFNDAETLWIAQKLPNASQLFGLSAECALKAVLVGLGVATNPAHGGVANTTQYGHLPGLWQQFAAYASGQLGGKYLAALASPGGGPSPFATWNVNDRYAPDAFLLVKNPDVANQRTGAQDCVALLELAQEDGIVQ